MVNNPDPKPNTAQPWRTCVYSRASALAVSSMAVTQLRCTWLGLGLGLGV